MSEGGRERHEAIWKRDDDGGGGGDDADSTDLSDGLLGWVDWIRMRSIGIR